MKFYGRVQELEELERVWALSGKSMHFTIISGRRRVGKTELVKQFFKGKKHLYFFIGRKNQSLLLDEMSSIARAKIGQFPAITRFGEWLEFLFTHLENGTAVFFDEFQNFKYVDESIFSEFQKIIDKHKNKLKIHVIVAGSHITLMNRIFSGNKEPLFGRATEKYILKPLLFEDVKRMLAEINVKSIEEQMKWYFVFGGMPKYYVVAEEQGIKGAGVLDALPVLLMRDFAPLRDEIKSMLSEEFGSEHPSYFSILEAVAIGNSEMTTIANKSGINIKSISKYLGLLVRDFGYLDYEVPTTEKKPWKSKKGRYFLSDSFMKFWFRYVYRNRSEYEIGNYASLMRKIKEDFSAFSGKGFEKACMEILAKLNRNGKLPSEFTKIGRWWHRDKEIDIICLNEKSGEIMFSECKWQDEADAEKILEKLKEKAKFVDFADKNRKEYYAVFAKSFRAKLRMPNVLLYDLKDVEKIMR